MRNAGSSSRTVRSARPLNEPSATLAHGVSLPHYVDSAPRDFCAVARKLAFELDDDWHVRIAPEDGGQRRYRDPLTAERERGVG